MVKTSMLAGSLLVALLFATDEPKGPAIGEAAPEWADLPGVDGKRHSLAELKDAKAVAVVFYANHCPDCQNYLDRIIALANGFQDKGVAFVLLSVSTIPEDGIEHMKEMAEEHHLPCQYLLDKSQKIGKAFGANTTPQIFLLDEKRRLAYRGAIDDHWNKEKSKVPYAKNAIEAVLAGKKPNPAETDAEGCFIVYEDE